MSVRRVPSMDDEPLPWAAAGLWLAVLLGVGSSGCNRIPIGHPLAGSVVVPTALPLQPQEIHELRVDVTDNGFGSPVYDVQTGPIRLAVTTHRGPYTQMMDRMVSSRAVPTDTTTTSISRLPARARTPCTWAAQLRQRPRSMCVAWAFS
jgi:hypothetical protein